MKRQNPLISNNQKKKLSPKFFENILNLEMELTNNFNIKNLTDLISLYSEAIEYYETFDLLSSKTYQNRMDMLLSDPETLKRLISMRNAEKKLEEQKKNNIIKNEENKINNNNNNINVIKNNEKNSSEKRLKDRAATMQFHRIKTQIKIFKDYRLDEIDQKFNTILKSAKEGKSAKDLLNKEIDKQNERWKKKLENKRVKFQFKSDMASPKHSSKNLSKINKKNLTPYLLNSRTSIFSKKINNMLKSDAVSEFSYRDQPDSKSYAEFDQKDEEQKMEFMNNKELNLNIKKVIQDDKEKIKDNNKEDNKEDNQEYNKEDNQDNNKENNKEDNKERIKEENKEEIKDNNKEDNKEDNKEENNEDNKEENNEENKEDNKEENKEENEDNKEEPRYSTRNEEENENKILIQKELKMKIDEKLNTLKKTLLNKNNTQTNSEDDDIIKEEEEEINIDEIPSKFQYTYFMIEEKIINYMDEFNEHFYKEVFGNFFNKLKRLIDEKYNKYIEITTEYHSQIKENEYLLDNPDLKQEEIDEINNTIESLKEEQQHEIDRIDDQYNSLISNKINEFKFSAFKNDVSINIIQEKLILEIYKLINDALIK